MVKRSLTKEERKLWQLYTRDVKPYSPEVDCSSDSDAQVSFKIKVPDRPLFKKRAETTVSNFETLQNKDSNWGKKLKQGKIKPDGKIDLHGMTCVEAHEKLFRYIERAQRGGKRVILVITGKGGPKKQGYADIRYADFESSRGILRREVPMWLSAGAMRSMIVSFQDARQSDGGSGALYVVLKRK